MYNNSNALQELNDPLEHISNQHPCFGKGPNLNKGRIHLPVSPSCNIQCAFCNRTRNKDEKRPGVTSEILTPNEAAEILDKALELSDSALAVSDSMQLFLFAKSTTLLRMERYGESIKVSDQLIQLNDTLAEPYFNAGTAYLNIALKLNPRKDKKQLKQIYQKTRFYMERYRQLMPNEKSKWGPALYRIYLNLNMGRQFDEIDRLLK